MTTAGTYQEGRLDGVLASGWTCPDCGNTYDARVESCPNLILDEACLQVRATSPRMGSQDTHANADAIQTQDDTAQFGYIAQQKTRSGQRVVVGPFATWDEAEKAAGGQPVVRMYVNADGQSEHSPECPNSVGSCCPWMGDCSCQCMCDFIATVEARVRNERGSEHLPTSEGAVS